MPPIQPSLRDSLLTGASALALSMSASGATAQTMGSPNGTPATLTVWAEGALTSTGGGSFNVPALPGPTAPFISFNPKTGYEGAVGFDYRWPSQPWHFVFDFRYGKTGSATGNSSTFKTFGTSFGVPLTSATSSQATERETHLVADFMIGRDLGLGSGTAQVQAGIRIADLWASAQVQETGQRTFYSHFSTVTAVQSATGNWSSRFFGAGPRLAITGGIPIVGPWSFDYGAGIAALFGDRSFNATVSNSAGPSFAASSNSAEFVFNADGWTAISYLFTPSYKLSGGIRADFYNAALTTYNVNTGGLENIDRLYWGPFLRLTGTF